MKSDRRMFLSGTAMLSTALLIHPFRTFAAGAISSHSQEKPGGLLLDRSDLPRIRRTVKHPRFAQLWERMANADLADDTRFLRDELDLYNHVRHLLRTWKILERSSFVYLVEEDKKHLEISLRAIERLLQFKKWDYFLEGGEITIGLQRAPETTIAMSLAREWLSDSLSSAMVSDIEEQIAVKGAPACYQTLYGMRHPDRVRGWSFDPESDYRFRYDLSRWPIILNSTNLKVIPIAGLAMAACLLRDRHPQAPRWLDMALQSARAFAPMYGSDGSYDEGISYWGYTTLHMTLFVEILYRSYGIDERSIINFPGTVRHALQMSMPTRGNLNDAINFGDAKNMGDLSVAGWIARSTNDGIAQHVVTSIGDAGSHFGVIWFDPDIESRQPTPELLDARFVNDWVVSRSGWDEQSAVVAFRSGGPANHEHADRNSVIFKAYGERLLHDPFNAAYSNTLPLWILRQTEAHTAVLIDGKGHQYHDGREGTNSSWAEARILHYMTSSGSMIATSDATDAYRLVDDTFRKVIRTVIFLKPDILILFDKISVTGDTSRVQLRFQIHNDDQNGSGTVTETGFRIIRPGAYLNAICKSESLVKITAGILDIPEGESADLYIGMEQTPKGEVGKYPYIQVETEPAPVHTLVSVCTAQRSGQPSGTVSILREGAGWRITGEHNGTAINVGIVGEGDVPDISIR